MNQSLMISLMAKDRPGIVGAVADAVKQQHGNWLESRLARLGGQFAGIIHVSVAHQHVDTLLQALQALNSDTLSLTVTAVETATSPDVLHRVHFSVVGNDRPGIVQEISRTIAGCGANLEELATHLDSAPWSGDLMFTTRGLVALPTELSIDELVEKLESLADDLIVEIDDND